MKQAKLIYHPKASETAELIRKIGEIEYGIEFIPLRNGVAGEDIERFYPNINVLPSLRYGVDSMDEFSKVSQLNLFEGIISNTLIQSESEWNDMDKNEPVILKNPTRLVCKKDVDWYEEDGEVYKFIKDKDEWRVNYSFGKVNSVLNKNITNQPFGKANLTEWTIERDSNLRKVLIFVTKRIAELVEERFPDVTHFGLDIIRDNTDDKMYLLELNRAHALNVEGVRYLLNGFINACEEKIPSDEFLNEQPSELLKKMAEVMGWEILTARKRR